MSEQWVYWLNEPYVLTLLIIIGLIGITIELVHPGFVAPGIIGILAFGIYFYVQMEAGSATWLSPVLFMIALVLLIIEMIIPGFGLFGIGGVLLLFYAVIAAASTTTAGIVSLAIGLLSVVLVIWVLVKFFGMKMMWNRVILVSEQTNEEGYRSSEDRKDLLGQTGVTITPLRPAGIVQFGDRREDVVSEREMIPENVEVIVILVEGARVVVRQVMQKSESNQ